MATIQEIEKTRGLVKHLFFKFFSNSYSGGKEFINSSTEKREVRIEAWISLFKAVGLLCIILAIVGAEAVKILMRKNYGSRGIDLVFLWVSIFCFLVLGGLGIAVSINANGNNYFFPISGLLASLFYFILSGILIKKAIIIYKKREIDFSFYEGDSKYLSELVSYGWNENTVKNVSEPVLVIFIGVFFVSFLGIFCLPIIFCGISIWVRQLTIYLTGHNTVTEVYRAHEYGAGTSNYNVVS